MKRYSKSEIKILKDAVKGNPSDIKKALKEATSKLPGRSLNSVNCFYRRSLTPSRRTTPTVTKYADFPIEKMEIIKNNLRIYFK